MGRGNRNEWSANCPSFNERYYGYGSFSDLLEDLESKKVIKLEYDERRGNFKVRKAK